ncbi:hypothetical protein [Desulfovibrio gilichinskyi]|uniref:Uncharacterized protein n=1 Tax=Desulfovibrio gilichinskyi TaxID=1519643 RepID=A0A1X7E7Z4_9BACT|nr:hypothetical protein [Desulfovibrio gilichinskyi]SMF28898.1 hypothetical protein SAMN06295933_2750 [Desulfovibrio gilichinskyi]
MSESFQPPWNWGVFKRKECNGYAFKNLVLQKPQIKAIYNALEDVGYRPTYWQYVYPKQVGGLVKSHCNGSLETHIRFFSDNRIYTEIEIGRIAFIHFSSHRYYANQYILRKLKKLPNESHSYLISAIENYKVKALCNKPEWSRENKFCTPSVRRLIKLAMVATNWTTLGFLLVAAVTIAPATNSSTLIIAVAIAIVLYLVSPKAH